MRTKAVLSFLVLTAVTLSGCADEPALKEWRTEPDGPEKTRALYSDPVPADESEPGDAGAETDAAPANAVPVANLTLVAPNGTQPGNVTFTLDGGDADGDALDWTFTVGNLTRNGTVLPATVNATLAPGDWTATLTVSDGRNETVAVLDFTVDGAGIVQAFGGSWAGGPFGCPPRPAHEAGLPPVGLLYNEVALRDGTGGRPFTAHYVLQDTHLHGHLAFYGADGALAGSHTTGDGPLVTGTVPDGAAWAVFSTCGVDGSAVTFQVL